MRRGRRLLRGLLALTGVAILVALACYVGGDAVLAALRRCTPGVLAGTSAAIVVATLLGAWNVYRFAELRPSMTFARFLPVYWRSWALGITLPGQVADMLTTLWQLKGRTGDLSFVAGRLLADKAITFGAMLALAALLPAVLEPARMPLSLGLLLALGVAAMLALAFAHWCLRRRMPWPRGRWMDRLRPALGAAVALPPRAAVFNAAVTIAKILLTGLAYWLVLRAIAPVPPSFRATTVISQSAGLVAYLPISLNGVGTVEVAAIALFGAIGIGSGSVLPAYLVMRAATLLVAWLPAAWWTLRHPAPGA